MNVNWEMTDTFGGESNYSWVKRGKISMPDNASNLSIVRAIKKEIGWNGDRCRTDNYGDMIALWPRRACMVTFITFEE